MTEGYGKDIGFECIAANSFSKEDDSIIIVHGGRAT